MVQFALSNQTAVELTYSSSLGVAEFANPADPAHLGNRFLQYELRFTKVAGCPTNRWGLLPGEQAWLEMPVDPKAWRFRAYVTCTARASWPRRLWGQVSRRLPMRWLPLETQMRLGNRGWLGGDFKVYEAAIGWVPNESRQPTADAPRLPTP